MQFSVLEGGDDGKLVLKLDGATTAFANSLRRTILAGLPCFAIDEVDFYENNSAMFNDFIANRLGLIPLTYSEEVGDDKKISLTLNVQGPGMIYSKDLASGDELIKPLNGNFPIMDLAENQRLRLEAWAVKATSKKHSKFQCAHAAYGYMPVFKVKKNSPKLKEFVAGLPASCLDGKGEPIAWKCGALEDFAAENPDVADYSLDEKQFIFTVESFNNVPAREHLRKALEEMGAAAKELHKQLK